MGNYFNLHPNPWELLPRLMKFLKLLRLLKGYYDWRRRYIGAACTFWQQLAINEASWVEAMEKPREQDAFLSVLKKKQQSLIMTEKSPLILNLDSVKSMKINSIPINKYKNLK